MPRATQFPAPPVPDEHYSQFRLQLRRRYWIPLVLTLVGAFSGALWSYLRPPMYISSAKMVVTGKIILPGGAIYAEELNNFFGTQVALMTSDEVRRRAAERVAATAADVMPGPVSLNVVRSQDTAIFQLSAYGTQPGYTRDFLEAVLSEYIGVKKEMRAELSDDELASITMELKRLDTEISQGEADLFEFQKNNNVGFLQEQDNSAAEYLVTLNRSLANLKNEYQLLQSLDLQNLSDADKERLMKTAQNDRTPATTASAPEASTLDEVTKEAASSHIASPEELAQAQASLALLTAQREEFAKVLRPEHPKMQKLDAQIDAQRKLLEAWHGDGLNDFKTRRDTLALEIANLEKTIKEWEIKAVDIGKRMAEYNRLKEQVDRAREVNQQQVLNLRNIDVNKNIEQDTVSVLEHASDSARVPISIWTALVLPAGAGLALGLIIIYCISRYDDRVLSVAELERIFPEDLLAQIPDALESRKRKASVDLLVENDSRHGLAEAFRSLRSSIAFIPFEGAAPRSLIVTSAVPGEGKSVISSNLAVTFAFAGARVLLIDGDLRRGSLHDQFGLPNEQGLADVLRDDGKPGAWRAAVQKTQTQGLNLLSRGGHIIHTGEKFLQARTDRLLKELYADYDLVIIDSAPVLVTDDTTSLAPKVDATLFVIRHSVSHVRMSKKALALLRNRQANILGLICNAVSETSGETYYGRYPEYYGTPAGTSA